MSELAELEALERRWPKVKWREPEIIPVDGIGHLCCRVCRAKHGIKEQDVPLWPTTPEKWEQHFAGHLHEDLILGIDGKAHRGQVRHTMGGPRMITDCGTPGMRPLAATETWVQQDGHRICPHCLPYAGWIHAT